MINSVSYKEGIGICGPGVEYIIRTYTYTYIRIIKEKKDAVEKIL